MDNIERLAREERLEYLRRWRKANPDKVKKIQENYWRKRAEQKFGEGSGTDDK